MNNTTPIINAFHPDFMDTYYPNFWKEFIRNTVISKNTTVAVTKLREKRPTHGTMFGISEKSVSTKPLDFLIYSRAGMPKKGKK
jgi:hypothetical protein